MPSVCANFVVVCRSCARYNFRRWERHERGEVGPSIRRVEWGLTELAELRLLNLFIPVILERRTMVSRRALDRGIHPSPLLWWLREELET